MAYFQHQSQFSLDTDYLLSEAESVDILVSGGPPWGFRLKCAAGGTAVYVRRVRRKSPAHLAGLMEGDQLLALNGASLTGRSHAYIVQVIERQRKLALRVRRSRNARNPFSGGAGGRAFGGRDASFCLDDDGESVSEVTIDGLAAATAAAGFGGAGDDRASERSWGGGGGGGVGWGASVPLEVEELRVPELQLGNLLVGGEDYATGAYPMADYTNGDGNGLRRIPFSKLVTEPQHQRESSNSSSLGRAAKPRYADSAYAGTPGYPTTDERKRMARRVARSLTDPTNRGSRGANMFEGRRQRAEKFTIEAEGSWMPASGAVLIDTSVGAPVGEDRDDWGITKVPMPPRPLTASSATWIFEDACQEQPKTVAEFVERELMSAPKLTHQDYDPAKAFNLAAALRTGSGKAGQMFEKRRHRANKFTVESLGRNAATAEDSPVTLVGGISEL